MYVLLLLVTNVNRENARKDSTVRLKLISVRYRIFLLMNMSVCDNNRLGSQARSYRHQYQTAPIFKAFSNKILFFSCIFRPLSYCQPSYSIPSVLPYHKMIFTSAGEFFLLTWISCAIVLSLSCARTLSEEVRENTLYTYSSLILLFL